MKKWGIPLLVLVLGALCLWGLATIPRYRVVGSEQVALDAIDLTVLRNQEQNRSRLRAAVFRSHTRAWFRNYYAPDFALHGSPFHSPVPLGETVLESHWQHWIRGDDYATSATLLDFGVRTRGSLPVLVLQPVLVRTTTDDGFYRTLTKHPSAIPSVERESTQYRCRDFAFNVLSPVDYAQRADWPDRQERTHSDFAWRRRVLSEEPARYSVSWTTVTLNGASLLRRRFLDAAPHLTSSTVVSEVLFDPSKGFEAVRIGPHPHNQSGVSTTDIDVREVAPGVWLAVRYETIIRDKTGKVEATIVSEIDMATASFNRPSDVDPSAFVIEVPSGGEFHDRRYGSVWEMIARGDLFKELWEEVKRFCKKIVP